MFNKITKAIMAMAAGVAVLAATPAVAGTVVTYWGPSEWGVWVPYGYDVWCDSGAYYGRIGEETPYSTTSYQSVAC